ncbi:MAG: sigma-70 family RNA polymerase sigma factor [Thermoflexibacter sp.]|jgi:RNA polymerase sigma-70 factor (ECF subfamily)|nr:sigma-70 family RNA polymerase sigma factor [Thermoflexibacter sp.]
MFKLLKLYKNENDLIADCLAGKRNAQEALYKKYSSKMLAICMRYLSDKAEAEDAMINGFIRVFSQLENFRKEGSFEGWIRRIIVNEALAILRKKSKMYLEPAENADYHSDYQIEEKHLEAEELMGMIQKLPTGYRTVFNLYAIEGYSHKEIAETLGITESTSKSQLNRARNMLKNELLKIDKSWQTDIDEVTNPSRELKLVTPVLM